MSSNEDIKTTKVKISEKGTLAPAPSNPMSIGTKHRTGILQSDSIKEKQVSVIFKLRFCYF